MIVQYQLNAATVGLNGTPLNVTSPKNELGSIKVYSWHALFFSFHIFCPNKQHKRAEQTSQSSVSSIPSSHNMNPLSCPGAVPSEPSL